MITSPEEYLASLNDRGREWVSEFFRYMDEKHPELKPVMFRQCPMYKFRNSYLDGYVMFTAATNHFSLHTLDFELIEEMKTILPDADFGKGCVKVKFRKTDAIPALKRMCDRIIERRPPS